MVSPRARCSASFPTIPWLLLVAAPSGCTLVSGFGDFHVGDGDADTAPDACVPECEGRECGPDGCRGDCGECPPYWSCNSSGRCHALCVPRCELRECGPDECGGECGHCPDHLECDDREGRCVHP